MSDTILAVIISVVVTALIAPIVLAFLNRNKDGAALAATALSVANQAVEDLRETKTEMAKQIKDAKIESQKEMKAANMEIGVLREENEAAKEDRKRADQDRQVLREFISGAKILTTQIEELNQVPRWRVPVEYIGYTNETPTTPLNGKSKNNPSGFFRR